MFVLCLVLRRRNWQISWYCWSSWGCWLGRCLQRNEKKERKKRVPLKTGDWTGGGEGDKKQKSCDANSKKSPICFTAVLQLILGRVSPAACRQTLSHIRPACCTLSSSLPSSLAAALLNHHPLSALHGCKQMQFCISCSLDTTEAQVAVVNFSG